MKKMKLMLAVLGLTLLGAQGYSQEATDKSSSTESSHRIGLFAGTTNGVGFSFKYTRNDKHQFQLAGIPIANSGYRYYNLGGTYYRKFINTRSFDILTYVGGGWSLTDDYGFQDHNVNASLGFAFEVGPSEYFKFNFQFGYGVYDIIDDFATLPALGVGIEFAIDDLFN